MGLNGAAQSVSARERLGIPADAARVLVFAESSHWDTNWLRTSDQYFVTRIEPIFTAVLRELAAQPSRVYSVESLYFLRRFWEAHPEHRDALRALLGERRLRLLAPSYTTPDTLLPHLEAWFRDYELGHQWLLEQGLPEATRTAYFPDNFGHSPHLPTLLRELGCDSVGLTRLDGMYFIAADWRAKRDFPRPGSSAELLQRELKTLDFVWRDDSGAEVLCHWNAFTYFQGDLLAHAGLIRWMGHTLGWSARGERHVARRIDGYVRELAPLSRTPYLFCPMGMDFNDPIARLPELLDRYNRVRYPATGTWTVLAALDDYFALLAPHRAELPVVQLDPNPYWMGFYASRPELKRRAWSAARALLRSHTDQRDAWEKLVLLNHHDAITGTSPDEVVQAEQLGWLPDVPASGEAGQPVKGSLRAGPSSLELSSGELTCVISRRTGHVERLVHAGTELLRGPGATVITWSDSGGLWRFGHEFRGGHLEELPAPAEAAEVQAVGDRVVAQTVTSRREFWLEGDALHVKVETRAARRRSISLRFPLASTPAELEMDTLGGVITRPRQRHFAPTFWPVPTWVRAGALTITFDSVTAVSLSDSGDLEWVIARNATKETAWGVLPVLAHPIGGTDDATSVHHAALRVTKRPEPRDAVRVTPLRRTSDATLLRVSTDDPRPRVVRVDVGRPVLSAVRCDALGRPLRPLASEGSTIELPLEGRLATLLARH